MSRKTGVIRAHPRGWILSSSGGVKRVIAWAFLPPSQSLTMSKRRNRTPGLAVVAKLKEKENQSKMVRKTDSVEDEIEFLRRTVFAGDESFVDREVVDSDGDGGYVEASSGRDLGAERGSSDSNGDSGGEAVGEGGGEEEEEDWALAGLLNSMLRGTAVKYDVRHEPEVQVEDTGWKPAKVTERAVAFENAEENERREREMKRAAEVRHFRRSRSSPRQFRFSQPAPRRPAIRSLTSRVHRWD